MARKKTPNYSKRSWKSLTKKQQSSRVKSLSVLKEVRHSQGLRSLSQIAKEKKVSLRTLKRHLGSNIYKKKGKFYAKSKDHIQRQLNIFENGKVRTVIVNDSRVASKIVRYDNAVKKALYNGKRRLGLSRSELTFKDAKGNTHYLDSSMSSLQEIENSRPKTKVFELDSDLRWEHAE